MKDIFKIFRRFLPPYKKAIYFNVFFDFFSAVFGIFSFITMIPILRILFGLEEKVYGFKSVHFSLSNFDAFKDALSHNIYSFITKVTENHSATTALIYIGILLVVMVILKTGFTYIATLYMVIIRNGVIRDVRNQLYRKTIGLPISFFTNEKKGDIIARMTGDVMEIEVSIVQSLEMLFKNPIIILVSFVTMILMSWQLTLFVLVLFPLSGLIIGRVGKSLKKSSMAGQNKLGHLLSIIEETLSGLRIIKAFNAEKKMDARFTRENEEYRVIMNKLQRRKFLASPISEFLGTIVMIILMWFGGNLILNNKSILQPEQFLVYLIVFYNIINPSKAFTQAFYSVKKGVASIDRIDKIMNTETSIIEIEIPISIKSFEKTIEYKNVSFQYVDEPVLKNINLKIEKGKSIALVGQSGSGKSTMVDLLPRFYDTLEGEIILDNINVKELKIKDLRNLFGIVNQEPILFNDTFFNNIAFGVETAMEEDVIKAAKIANAHDFIIATPDGYQSNIGDRGSKLSGGQRQRISIARAILKNPPILILDEATSSLDTESERLVQDAITNLMKNRTSIIIAHRLSTVVHADEICVIQDGEIIERGKHKELLAKKGEYNRFYKLQNLP